MTKNFAYELAPYGIRVNCVIPGAIAERPGAPPRPEMWAGALRNIPSGRLGRAEDIATAVPCCPRNNLAEISAPRLPATSPEDDPGPPHVIDTAGGASENALGARAC